MAAARQDWTTLPEGVELLVGPAALTALQFVLFAGGQPGEYGRFALFPDIAVMIGAEGRIKPRVDIPRMSAKAL